MGKTRDLFKKIRDTKGTFHAKMGSIKDRNSMDLTEEDIKKRWQEYTELYKKDLHDPDNHDGMITYLESDTTEATQQQQQQKQKILGRGGKNTQKNCTKKVFMTQIITMV